MKHESMIAGILISLLFVFSMLHLIEQKTLYSQDDTTEVSKIPQNIISSESKKIKGIEQESKKIRVLIKTSGWKSIYHKKVEVSVDGKTETLKPNDKHFQKGTMVIQSDSEEPIRISSIKRGYGHPIYEGTLEVFQTKKGLVVVNEIPLESYLKGVVPGEMPTSYEVEALKAQAICARSYAVQKLKEYSYPEYKAHVDDSTSFQVYQNSLGNERTDQAVAETKGKLLSYNGKIVSAYYFSTSSGKTTSIKAWGTKESEDNGYLRSIKVTGKDGADCERKLPWYRWTITVSKKKLGKIIESNLKKNPKLSSKSNLGELASVAVTKKGPGDIAQSVKITGSKEVINLKTEHDIREALGSENHTIKRNDGTKCQGQKLLPSAFFTISQKGNKVIIRGGGLGHGIGMSQNGANQMAKEGMKCEEILKTFFQGIEICINSSFVVIF